MTELTDGEKFALLRKRAGMSQDECAEKIGISRHWLSQVERDITSSDKVTDFWESYNAGQ